MVQPQRLESCVRRLMYMIGLFFPVRDTRQILQCQFLFTYAYEEQSQKLRLVLLEQILFPVRVGLTPASEFSETQKFLQCLTVDELSSITAACYVVWSFNEGIHNVLFCT